MSLVSITDAERYEVGYRVNAAATHVQRFVNNTNAFTSAQEAVMSPAITEAVNALATAGYIGIPPGSALIADGSTVHVYNSVGSDVHDALVRVQNEEVVGIDLSADTVALVDHTDAVELRRADGSVIGTGITTAQARVAAGVLANVRLPITADAVQNNMAVQVRNSAGADTHNGTAVVASNGALTGFNLAASIAMVDNADSLNVINSAGADSHAATAVVSAAGNVTGVRLAATVALVDNADVVPVRNSAGADSHDATAVVAAGVITGVNLAATVGLVDAGDSIPVHGGYADASGDAQVTAGVVTGINLPAANALLANGQALTVPVTGTYATTATLTIVGGLVTGIVLS